ncbi:Mitochondrial import inner membrane protein [Klebsormidium nitens]|uniref:Mitochondrial import inner membrane translocase subunit n=1 Tax=Klebsormidium nitens TaxID=105231 RepID=A0A1Y1ILD2_KLENI|nr:Mitochondrial import inner membrane protein [Klebsormidium nitens]|eukprot:GAQ91473.1 Mitochondrial import inner membrane protein [Klebsormidium nitens]
MAAMPGSPSGINREQAFAVAQQEMEYRVDLFNKLAGTCFEKCMEKRLKEGDLNVGETSCIDRCVAKYWQVTGIIGQMLSAGGGGVAPR